MQLLIVPQNGGRLIQVTFGGHAYLFVNPKFTGKYLPPSASTWFNYGGDKLWPLPEGNNDEQHWAGASDVLDDGPFTFRKTSEGQECEIELVGSADPQTGIQFSRTIRIDSDSLRIRFRATMTNATGHTIEWSMQSVSQYDTSESGFQRNINHNFWTFTRTNPSSSYLNRYHVRFGPAENPAASVRDDNVFSLHDCEQHTSNCGIREGRGAWHCDDHSHCWRGFWNSNVNSYICNGCFHSSCSYECDIAFRADSAIHRECDLF